jgi:hypothetical protein
MTLGNRAQASFTRLLNSLHNKTNNTSHQCSRTAELLIHAREVNWRQTLKHHYYSASNMLRNCLERSCWLFFTRETFIFMVALGTFPDENFADACQT